jgi:predicted TIM-barrel fold metal-dependent hydrolase
MPDPARRSTTSVGPVIDSNMHVWDQRVNPVFWLTDRTLVRDVIGNYDSLPDTYTLADYLEATASFDVRGVVWSDPGAADPVAAAEWVAAQDTDGRLTGLVGLADPADPGFESIVRALRANPLVSSVRIRVAAAFGAGAPAGDDHLLDAVAVLDDLGLVATIEASADQLPRVSELARRHPGLRIVLDQFGWPTDVSDAGRRAHLAALTWLADESQVSTRIEAIGAIFGNWDVDTIRPWLVGVVDAFGPSRCMLGSDYPVESLRSSFDDLYAAYDVIFDSRSDDDRRLLFADTAQRVYGR